MDHTHTGTGAGAVDPASHALDELASWSPWLPLADAVATAPRSPGVYVARMGALGATVYVGMAGERRGDGLRGRLSVYSSGKGMVSGLGEALTDRALADATWLEDRLAEVRAGRPRRAKEWARLAAERADLHLRWAVVADTAAARALERAALDALAQHTLWNRLR